MKDSLRDVVKRAREMINPFTMYYVWDIVGLAYTVPNTMGMMYVPLARC
jgi:hypothetical protein